ncbi:MAG: SusD/RagB family nutrient-binding outer membrane lipoprotein [Bacteroidetes bacterium]|nr:SusD/RagB family nutrient-binding outer membrane lipoprotein [Bacteroidota bacterium]
MKSAKRVLMISCVFLVIISVGDSCKKFSVLNSNPNSIAASGAAPDYLMAGVLTSTAQWYGNLGSGVISGAMQESAQDAFQSTFSAYQWDPGNFDWSGNYAVLKNNKALLQQAIANNWDFHQGVALVMRAFQFGNIADFWGDAPDSMAVSGDLGGAYQFPTFDAQQNIYNRVIADLKAAIPHFQGTMATHPEITTLTQSSDVFYGGDPTLWKKFTFSLLLRYYMRLSSKMNVQANVEAIADSVFQSTADDCMMMLPGKDQASSYQFCSKYNGSSGYNRNKMSGTMTMALKALKDPRIVIMAEPILVPSVVDTTNAIFASGSTTLDSTVNGIRYINAAAAVANNYKQFNLATYTTDRPWEGLNLPVKNLYDTSSVYVGIPISYSNYPDFQYNINTTGTQATSINSYVSYLRRDIYDNPSGPLLAQRIASYAEICFDLAEAAQKGWNVGGSASAWYYKGIQASFDTWQVFSSYQSDVDNYYGCVKDAATYMAQPAVAYNATIGLQQIITQKWIAAWQACNEAFMDWRRTGFPTLTIGFGSYRGQIPVRFTYANSELQNNSANANVAIAKLVPSANYNGPDGNNSSWSKFWLLQGTSEPW